MADSKFNTPTTLADPYKTYTGYNKGIINQIDQRGSVETRHGSLDKHVNTPGAVIHDPRYVNNVELDTARKNALQKTLDVMKAEGGELAEGVKNAYAEAMAQLKNAHTKIGVNEITNNARIRDDIQKIIEMTAQKTGKKVAVVVGFLASSASFANETITVSGQIIHGEATNTEALKKAGVEVANKGVEGAIGVVDPLGTIKTNDITRELLNGNLRGAAVEFYVARENAAQEFSQFVQEQTR